MSRSGFEIRVHRHGEGCVAVLRGYDTKQEARDFAKQYAAALYPGCTITKSGQSALLVTREGEPVATIAVEPHTGST